MIQLHQPQQLLMSLHHQHQPIGLWKNASEDTEDADNDFDDNEDDIPPSSLLGFRSVIEQEDDETENDTMEEDWKCYKDGCTLNNLEHM